MKKLPDRPGDVKVDAIDAATLVAARREHDRPRRHRRSLIQVFVRTIKDRLSKLPASFGRSFPLRRDNQSALDHVGAMLSALGSGATLTSLIVMPLCGPGPRKRSPLHRGDDLPLKEKPPLKTL